MKYQKGDYFFHKEYKTIFTIDSINGDLYTCFYPNGHPNRSKPWARYSQHRINTEAIKLENELEVKTMRILYAK